MNIISCLSKSTKDLLRVRTKKLSKGYHCSSLIQSTSASTSPSPIVSTYREVLVPTEAQAHRVPLSVVDIHLRDEELPFAYFFEETLGEHELEESLRLVLRDFPQLGGRISSLYTSIQCNPNDSVRLAFGRINLTMDEWKSQPRGHVHQSFSSNRPRQNGARPQLLPLFDSLFSQSTTRIIDSVTQPEHVPLAKIRVTYFKDKWTAIGVNVSHALGDTATCIHFVQSWGKQMRRKPYEKWGTDRSRACVSGMMTEIMADVMGIHHDVSGQRKGYMALCTLQNYVLAMIFGKRFIANCLKNTHRTQSDVLLAPTIRHEYVRLVFPAGLIIRLKEIGESSSTGTTKDGSPYFVSTNDMLTSYGWLLKCHLAREYDRGLSMVYNLRGRSDVNTHFFGNGISHVTTCDQFELQPMLKDDDVAQCEVLTKNICDGAKSIRRALKLGLVGLPEALAASRIGQPQPAPAKSRQSFSTTSWGQFPLYKIRFADHALIDFHGHPAHPLPPGRTYASVITPSANNSVWYEMLLPSDQAEEALKRHSQMSSICMEWVDPREAKDL